MLLSRILEILRGLLRPIRHERLVLQWRSIMSCVCRLDLILLSTSPSGGVSRRDGLSIFNNSFEVEISGAFSIFRTRLRHCQQPALFFFALSYRSPQKVLANIQHSGRWLGYIITVEECCGYAGAMNQSFGLQRAVVDRYDTCWFLNTRSHTASQVGFRAKTCLSYQAQGQHSRAVPS